MGHAGQIGMLQSSTANQMAQPGRFRSRGFCPRASIQQQILNATCMEEAFDALAKRSIAAIENTSSSSRHLIGIAGAPGSGKSTLAKEVTKRINVVLGQDVAVNVPMDGYHLYRRQLDVMADPDEAYRRRGAPWTFDASAYVAFMSAAKQLQASGTLWAPSFDHGVGDPVEHAIKVTPNHRVLLSEGNYVLLEDEPWNQLENLWADSWYIDCPLDVAMQRIFARQTGNGLTPEASLARIQGNDRPNGQVVATSKQRARLVVPSLPFKELR